MHIDDKLLQNPTPGTRLVKFCGDTLALTLTLPHPQSGTAWVRTNLGQAQISRREIIREVEHDETRLGRDWFDIPMSRADEKRFHATLPMIEVGHFEAKCYFLKEGETNPIWPQGPNIAVNVDPADACCANIIYNGFVRQFGPNKTGKQTIPTSEGEIIKNLDQSGYTIIPPSGTFRDLIAELDFIFGELECRILMLLPIHPTPTTYGRMGRFGSPYAALSFTAVDPALAVFDPHATPLEQFIELVDAVHQRAGKILIDIAINHTGWAANLHETHPNWLVRGPQGRIEVPGAWGVRWEDLTKLDYTNKDLWRYMADMFITWCRRGVDGFRCDAGYMIPLAAWKYIIAKVRDQFQDAIFLLEGLGGKISVTRDLLNLANLNWAYSELFQNYDRNQIENYLPEAINISNCDGITVHFAETHDNPRLATRSKEYARMRTALCALCSNQGAFGFANGVEWFATDKINVHNSPSLNWGAESNQINHIRRLNQLLKVHPAFHDDTELSMLQQNGGNHIVLLRHQRPSGKKLLVIINLDDKNPTFASWNPAKTGLESHGFTDLLSGAEVTVAVSGNDHTCRLEPAEALCLSTDATDLELFKNLSDQHMQLPKRIEIQRLRAKVLEVFAYFNRYRDLRDFDIEQAVQQMKENPLAFCANLNSQSDEPQVTIWQWPRDIRREVMIPPGHFLLIKADWAFRARIADNEITMMCTDSLPGTDGAYFVLFAPLQPSETGKSYTLKLSVYAQKDCEHVDAPLFLLPKPHTAKINRIFRRPELLRKNFLFLSSNGRGGMLRAPVSWGKLTSRYDGLLAANMSPNNPEDRWIMLTRCRAWLVYQGYSQEINTNCLEAFGVDDKSKGYWQYHIPAGQGENVLIIAKIEMIAGENAVRLTFSRQPVKPNRAMLDDYKAVKLILRPDLENRNFHESTKAYRGPEHHWPESISVTASGFAFHPDENHHLHMEISDGNFIWESEWQYMVHRSMDAERGMDPNSDLYSPGYFCAYLEGGQEVVLTAAITANPNSSISTFSDHRHPAKLFEFENDIRHAPSEVLNRSLNHYIANRGVLKTVIAGYPWFLDWGRDALIFARGLVAVKQTASAQAILKQFGQFEEQGTLPNMIVGQNAGNRDTSDAPLWFFTLCSDFIRVEGNNNIINTQCGDRSIGQILLSIGQSIINGTANGIRMDPESGLVFSPAHFSWMDTDHPAGTPREGYPIEIQALWCAALQLLSRIDSNVRKNWDNLAKLVQTSILNYFWCEDLGYLSDCLHTPAGHSAKQALPDDALRPNQLLAINLGAVTDSHICRHILAACESLLVPGAIRSLADQPVRHPIEIVHRGNRLNDPHHPYRGRYVGDEDTQRKPAYHNGTAWTWLFPSFCEAWAMVYGDKGKETAMAWLTSSIRLMDQGCLDHIPEILDGDYPHSPRGCDAQAWGASEWLRVWLMMQGSNHN